MIQIKRFGFGDYFSSFSNYLDMTFIVGSILTAILHLQYSHVLVGNKIIMIIVILSAIRRTFSFLRIFSDLTKIVAMMNEVMFQLWKFMTFFIILCILLSLMFSVLGIGSIIDPKTDFHQRFVDDPSEAPNAEY